MSHLNHKIYDARKTVRYIASSVGLIATVAQHVARKHRAKAKGICLIYNNLQPHGHEYTFRRAGAQLRLEGYHDDDFIRGASGHLFSTPTLMLSYISTTELLEVRQVNGQTGEMKRDCRYCRFLCDVFDAFFVDKRRSWLTKTRDAPPFYQGIHFGLMIRENMPLIINCYSFTFEEGVDKPRIDLEVYSDTVPSPNGYPPALPRFGPTGHRSNCVQSPRCMQFIRESVMECWTDHRPCTSRSVGEVPTRLIYLGANNGDLRLFEHVPVSHDIFWAALSHCWGGHQPFKLLKENLERLKERINASDLPPTFSNAVDVCRELGLQYLWIDSLCIIQDDRADWDFESTCMGTVFSGASIVICAASSPNPYTTFLGPRDEEWLPKTFELQDADGSEITFHVRRHHLQMAPLEQGYLEPPFTSEWATVRRRGPLYTRGWCFQEMFLAKRILHFSPGAVIFECKTHRRSEDQLPPFPITKPSTLGDVDAAVKWRMIVQMYTQRELTYASDKLPAIAGAAQTMVQAQRTQYLAGLWRETLLLDLLWEVMPESSRLALKYETGQLAPTWSWVSVNRGVTWKMLETFRMPESPIVLAEVISADTTLAGTDPFGAVNGGRLVLKGRCILCELEIPSDDGGIPRVRRLLKGGYPDFRAQWIKINPDGLLVTEVLPTSATAARRARGTDVSLKLRNPIALLVCIAKTAWFNYKYIGLVLSPSKNMKG